MISTFEWWGYNLPKEENYKMIKQSGFDGIMLWWSDEFGDVDFRKNPEIARNIGLVVENIHSSFKNINNIWVDNLSGIELTQYYLALIEECADYEIPAIVMHPSSGDNPPLYNSIGLDRLKRIVNKAEQKNIDVAFENMRRHDYLAYILNNIQSKRAGFCFDSGHHHYWSSNCDLLSQYGSRLMALHLHDNNKIDDQHLLPFDGTIEWASMMHEIKETFYKGMIALEVENIGYKNVSPECFLQTAAERAKKLEAIFS